MDLIDRSKLPRIRITGFREDRLLTEVFGVLNDAIQKAPTVDAVPREEHESLLKRFRHLLESDFIRSFDEYDPKTGTYKRDISEAMSVETVIHCEDCEMWGRSPWGSSVLGWCKLYCTDIIPKTSWLTGEVLDVGICIEYEDGDRFWCHWRSRYIEEMITEHPELSEVKADDR